MKAVNNLRWALMTVVMTVIFNINAQTTDIHVVKRGETFTSIAKKYGTTEAELRKANPNVKNCIAGLKLKIASPVPSKKETIHKDTKITSRQVNQQIQKTSYADNQTVHMFEGMLLYRNYEHHNTMVRKLSAGQAYNGERTVKVTLRDNSAHIIDEDMHIHTIVLPEEDKIYMYNDVSKMGFVANGSEFLNKFFSSNNPDITPTPETKKISTLQTTGKQETFKGDICQVYAGQITVDENILTDVEMWYSDRLLANKSYRQLFNGLPVPGIVRKGIFSQTGKLPLLGSLRSTVAYELVGLTECKVSDAEFVPPQDIKIEPYTKDTQLHSFYKNSTKALKKANLYPKLAKTKEIDYKINQEWDFADEWLKKKVSTENNTIAWNTIGNSILDLMNTLSGDKTNVSSQNTHVQGSDAAIVNPSNPSTADLDKGEDEEFIDELSAENLAQNAELAKKYEKVRNKYNSIVSERRQASAEKMSLASTHSKANPHTNSIIRAMQKESKLIRDGMETALEMKQIRVEIETGKRMTDAELASERKRIANRTNELEIKIKKYKVTLFSIGEGARYVDYYNEYRSRVEAIKNDRNGYEKLSISSKERILRESQAEMKKLRSKYKEGCGKDLPGASSSLENWSF